MTSPGAPLFSLGSRWLKGGRGGQVSTCTPANSWCPARIETPQNPPSPAQPESICQRTGPSSLPGVGTVIHPMACVTMAARYTAEKQCCRPGGGWAPWCLHIPRATLSQARGINWVNIEEGKKQSSPSRRSFIWFEHRSFPFFCRTMALLQFLPALHHPGGGGVKCCSRGIDVECR